MKVEMISYEDLTEDQKELQPDNGSGKELASYIRVSHKGDSHIYSDAMEPEDAVFYRDMYWIVTALELAYERGRGDGFISRQLNSKGLL